MITYKERIQNKTNYVLIENDVVLGTFGNLKKITGFMKGKDFPSYWTLVRKKIIRLFLKTLGFLR